MLLHHVRVACARGTENSARGFYRDGLGMTEVEKPDDLKPKGRVWFRAHAECGAVAAEFYGGVEDTLLAGPQSTRAAVRQRRQLEASPGGARPRIRMRLEPATQRPRQRAVSYRWRPGQCVRPAAQQAHSHAAMRRTRKRIVPPQYDCQGEAPARPRHAYLAVPYAETTGRPVDAAPQLFQS